MPVDHVCTHKSDKKNRKYVVDKMTGDMVGYDIGDKTIKLYADEIAKAGQIFWNGPMGLYEQKAFEKGTLEVAKAIGNAKGYSIVGGGDTVAAVNHFRLGDKMNYISTGGGATLKFLEEGTLPCIEVIQEKIL